MIRHIPNALTSLRLVLAVAVFALLLSLGHGVDHDHGRALWALGSFVLAALTDLVDGWLARRLQAETPFGVILDPIADKILVAGSVVGLASAGYWTAAAAGGLILFREFAVSALREVLAQQGRTLPVSGLAKAKTALQLLALTVAISVMVWPSAQLAGLAALLLWAAAGLTLWTGLAYGWSARHRHPTD